MCLSITDRRKSLKSGLTNDDKTLLPVKQGSKESLKQSLNQDSSSVIPYAPKSCDTVSLRRQRKTKIQRIIVHDYHDHANDSELNNKIEKSVTRGGVTVPFPTKLFDMLDSVESKTMSHIVSWQPHGRCFLVHDPKKFVESIIPKYFHQKKYASFQRQLNLYGFSRLTKGRDKGGYYHELFLRGKRFLSHQINRIKIKGTGARMASNPDSEPNFYAMTPATGSPEKINSFNKRTSCQALLYPQAQSLHSHRSIFLDKKSLHNFEKKDTEMFDAMPFHYVEIPTCEDTSKTVWRSESQRRESPIGIKLPSPTSTIDRSTHALIVSDSEEEENCHLLKYPSSINEVKKIRNENMDENSSSFLSEIDSIACIGNKDIDDHSLGFMPDVDEVTGNRREDMDDHEFLRLLKRFFY